MKKPDDRPRGYHGHFTSQKKIKSPVEAAEEFNQRCEREREQIKESIAEYLKDNAWIEDDPKNEQTQITFSKGINIGILVTAALFWSLLFVIILYVGMRI
jgi:hypothetical protein